MCNSYVLLHFDGYIGKSIIRVVISQYKLISAENLWHECKFKWPTGNIHPCPNKIALSLSLFHLVEVNKKISIQFFFSNCREVSFLGQRREFISVSWARFPSLYSPFSTRWTLTLWIKLICCEVHNCTYSRFLEN